MSSRSRLIKLADLMDQTGNYQRATQVDRKIEKLAHEPEGHSYMSESNLQKLHEYSGKLMQMIPNGAHLDDWVEDKISSMSDDISEVYHYLSSYDQSDFEKSAGYGDYPGTEIPRDFPDSLSIKILSENNFQMPLIQLFQERGLPPGPHGEDELTAKTIDFGYTKIDKEIGGFGKWFYLMPEVEGIGTVKLTEEGMQAVKEHAGQGPMSEVKN